MSEPHTGTFKIISLIDDNPATSITTYVPTSQTVRLNEALQIWKIMQYWASPQTYWFAIDAYPYTGLLEEKVTATVCAEQDVKWHVTYREAHNAYTIEPDNDREKGWTVTSRGHQNPEIVIAPIVSRSIPPQFSPSQLFRFVKQPINR